MKMMTPEDYLDLVKNIHELVMAEIEKTNKDESYDESYYNLVIMYEFFRMLRGEAFLNFRPSVGDKQSELYKMQNEIEIKFNEIKSKVNLSGERALVKPDIFRKLYFNK